MPKIKGLAVVFMLTISIFCFATHAYGDWIHKYEGHQSLGGTEYAVPNIRESSRLDVIAKYLPESPVIFEAGAHYGEHTAILSSRWPQGDVVAFEANPAAYIKAAARVKNIKNVSLFHLAVNNYNGEAVLNVCYGSNGDNPAFEGASSLLEPSDFMKQHYQGPKVQIPCVILDDWCKENGINHFDFMWLDLEGLELQVLKSSPNLLAQLQVIYTETNFRNFREEMSQYHELKSFLEDTGFILLAHWYSEDAAGPFQGDAVFIRKEMINEK